MCKPCAFGSKQEQTSSLLNTSKLKSCVKDNLQCKHCNGTVRMRETSVGLATTLVFECCNGHHFSVEPETCPTLKERSKYHQRASNFEINVSFVLGLLASGCGGTESSIIASFLGLPLAQCFGQNLFTSIKDDIGCFMRETSNQSMDEALATEVKMTVSDYKYQKWKYQYLPGDPLPEVAASYDMGWQKRSSGRTYNSISGHGMMIGCQSNKIIDAIILSKKCNICSTTGPNPPPHTCPKNYDSSSKGMEAEGSLRLCRRARERRYNIGIIVSDDDSTMRAVLKHSHKDKQEKDATYQWPRNLRGVKLPDKGRLPLNMPEPTFYANSHLDKLYIK